MITEKHLILDNRDFSNFQLLPNGQYWAEVGKVTFKSNTNEVLNNDFFLKSNAMKC
jgi:hypothetical protein